MGFAAGFRAGWDSVSEAIKDRERQEMLKGVQGVLDAKPEQSQGYTAEQGRDLEAAAARGDKIDIAYKDDGKGNQVFDRYVVTAGPNSAVSDPSVLSRDVSMQGVTDFLGNRTSGTLTEPQMQAIRTKAVAGVVGRYDPIKGVEMTRQAALDQENTQRQIKQDTQLDRQNARQDAQDAMVAKRFAREKKGWRDEDELRGVLEPRAPGQLAAGADAVQTATGANTNARGQAPIQDKAPTLHRGDGPDGDLQRYMDQNVPKAITTLIKQGRIDDARKFSDFVESQEGRAYANNWLKAIRRLEVGDHAGALQGFERLYNEGLPDGKTVRLTPQDEGQRYLMETLDAKGTIVDSRTLKTADLANGAAAALAPSQAVKHYADRAVQREKDAAALQVEELRQQGLAHREDLRQRASDDRLDRRLEAQSRDVARRMESRGTLTVQQERQNQEIEAARERIAGLSADEIRRRTTPTTATGRDNPDFDPQLVKAANLAGRRKIGDDPAFDARQNSGPPQQGQGLDRSEVGRRFTADKSMNRYRLGKQTPQGFEVLDASGKVIGHYN